MLSSRGRPDGEDEEEARMNNRGPEGGNGGAVCSLARAPSSVTVDAALASDVFDRFCAANTLKSILRAFRCLCEALRLKPAPLPHFYPRLRARLRSWRAQAIWAKLDRRAALKCYRGGRACAGQRVLCVGAGPCGLRTAVEAQLLGAKVVVVEKRDRYSRNNVLHLWPINIHDLRGLGAKKFYGQFCAGAIDHISIRVLQCILLKVALLLGVEVFENVGFEELVEPPDAEVGWRARVSPPEHPVSQFEFDVLVGADGKRNTLPGFRRKEFRGKLAIAVTANFINRHTEAESRVEEISGVAFIFNQKFFNELQEAKRIALENIVYYRDETHYFVMTAKKQSLLDRGVILRNEPDTARLLAADNICQEALFEYAREAADFATGYQLPRLEFAVNHYGKPDVAMFDFTSMFQAENSCRVVERHGHRLLLGLVGDSLLEPFWPTGTGIPRGVFGGLDFCWLMRAVASGKHTLLECLAERESVYRILAQTTPDNTCKDLNAATLDPGTRYVGLNRRLVLPGQVTHLVDTDNPKAIEEELAAISRAGETAAAALNDSATSSKHRRRRKESHVSPDALLAWFQKQLEAYDCVAVSDMTYSFQSGLALCAVIHRYRPDLIDFQALDPSTWAENNQLAFDLLEHELGVSPAMTGRELAQSRNPDKLAMIAYLSQVHEIFRKEIPVSAKDAEKARLSEEDLLEDTQYRYNHPKNAGKAMRRKHDSGRSNVPATSIGQLVAGEAISKKKKRRSKEDRLSTSGNRDEAEVAGDDENLQETLRMNRSAHKKRMEKLQEAANRSDNPLKKKHDAVMRQSIKKDDRFKAIEEKFGASGSRRRQQHADALIAKHREEKKPKDLKRAIGKIGKDDWNIRNIEKKAASSDRKHDLTRGKVPKWSKAAFQDKLNLVKGRLETSSSSSKATAAAADGEKFVELDGHLAALDRKLREGGALETGQRGANKVSALAEELFVGQATAQPPAQQKPSMKKKESTSSLSKKGGSESCHFCSRRVYVVERMSAEGRFFHRSCFRCDYCNILLRLGSYVHHREGPFEGKFFCIPHSTDYSLEKYRYKRKEDELRDAAAAEKGDKVRHDDGGGAVSHEWGRKDSVMDSLSDRHRKRLLREQDKRESTPERVEFEASLESEEKVPSIMDEEEWESRNFGNSMVEEEGKEHKDGDAEGGEKDKDTSDDSVSDLETDTDEDEDDDDGPGSRPLTADEARQLRDEWMKKYAPSGGERDDDDEDDSDSDYENADRRLSSSTCDSSSLSERELDYEAEYESDSESDDDDERPNRPPPPPPPAPPQRKSRKYPRGRRDREDSTEESDTSTEVGSSDLSSADDSSDDDDVELSSSDEFSSASATECEFTDSEGRPNPFHKELEDGGGRVVGPESPGATRRIYAQHVIPADPSQEGGLIKAPEYEPQLTYANRYQYKTPNLSDRLRTEQQTTVLKAQDFSTRRALNLKKNWVSDSNTDLSAAAAKKKPENDKGQIDSRLKSLMDRLSNQQKLLKPAEKPSTEMQHFLKASQSQQQTKVSPSMATSPPVTSPPASSVSTSFNALYPPPPVYKSVGEPILSPTSDQTDAKNDIDQSAMKKTAPSLAAVAEESSSDRSFAEKNELDGDAKQQQLAESEVIDVIGDSSKVVAADDSKELEDSGEVHEAKNAAPLALNETVSSTKDEDFQSCEEEEEDVAVELNEAFNPELSTTNDASKTEEFFSPEAEPAEETRERKTSVEVTPPEEPASLPPREDCTEGEEEETAAAPLASSSPVEIALIDDDSKDDIEEEVEPEPEEPRQPVFTEGDVTEIYQERNPQERRAKLNHFKQKEKSVVHELILSRGSNRARSSSAARRPMRTLPTSGPPPPPPDEPPAERPSQPPPKIKGPTKSADNKAWSSYTPGRGATVAAAAKPASALERAAPLAAAEDTMSPAKKSNSSNVRPGRGEVRQLNFAKSHDELAVSPTASLNSNCDVDSYMDGMGSTSGDDSKASKKSTSTANVSAKSGGGDKRNFMRAISGIFNRSASLSSVNRSPRLSLPAAAQGTSDASKSSHHLAASPNPSQQQRPNTASDNNNQQQPGARESKTPNAGLQQQQHNFRFPKLNFSRSTASSSAQPDASGASNNSSNNNSKPSPDSSPSVAEAPRADISELNSLSSSVSATPKDFRGPLNLKMSHPSTPPVPLSRKITLGLETSASTGSVSSTVSENEENESPEDVSLCLNEMKKREEQLRERQVPAEILEKLLRRGGTKAAKRQARVARVKRVRRAQEIQRHLEELDVQHRDLEERGVKAERSIRGESSKESGREAELMHTWFRLLTEKNRLVRREQELLVQAKQLELEDRSAGLEAELREHLMLDARSPEGVAREGEVLGELLSISEQREKLQAMLERDRQRYQREDKDMEAQMAARGVALLAPIASADEV